MSFYKRLPSARDLEPHRAKIGGFFAGAFGMVLMGLLFGVIYTGQPAYSEPSPDLTPVYPNL